MQRIIYFLMLLLLIQFPQTLLSREFQAQRDILKKFETIPFSKLSKKRIAKGAVISDSKVDSYKDNSLKKQKFQLKIAAMHKTKNCQRTFQRLSQYENYKNLISFVTESSYLEKEKEISLLLETPLFPVKLRIKFKLPRIYNEGVYPFIFESGFMPGLKGKIHVSNHLNRCLIFLESHWDNLYSGYSDILLEVFAQTASRVALDKLIRL